jgi:hypothetical protein
VLARGVDAYAPGLAEAARRFSWQSYAERLLEYVGSLTREG